MDAQNNYGRQKGYRLMRLIASFAFFFGVWELVGRWPLSAAFPPFSLTFLAFLRMIGDGSFLNAYPPPCSPC